MDEPAPKAFGAQPKVTIDPTESPSDQLIREAAAPVIVPDAKGRKITLAKPAVLEQFRLVKILGAAASNEVYMGMVLPLLFVRAIDADPVFTPKSENELDALIQRLDEHGVAAVATGVNANWGAPDPAAAAADIKK